MNRIFAGVDMGKKNIIFAIALFLSLGVLVGAPLTVDLFGGSLMSESHYQAWKVLHAYGVFLAFVNFFFGFLVDRMSLDRRQVQIASWSFMTAGLVGGLGRPVLFLLSVPGVIGSYTVSLIETLGFVIGTFIFVRGRIQNRSSKQAGETAQPVSERHTAVGSWMCTWQGTEQLKPVLEAHGCELDDHINF